MYVTPDTNHIALPWREDLSRLIPHAKAFEYQGNKMLLIPNRHDEAKVARNIGIPVPAPILTRYDWRGHKPWDIQKTTAALLTESSRAYVLNSMGCVDAETEYLAPDGWHRIASYKGGDVAEYRPGTGTIAFVTPSQFVKLPCLEMVRFKTTRGVDQLLSPEHRVLYVTGSGARRVDSAVNIYNNYDNISPPSMQFITTFRVEGTPGLPLSDEQIRLQVAVNADGYQMPYGSGKVSVRVKKERKKERMRLLLADAEVPYAEGPSGVGFTAFRFVPPEPKHKYDRWWAASQRQLEVVASEAPHWDGSHRKAGGLEFSSYAKNSVDFVQYAFSASGMRASMGVSERVRRGAVEREWRTHASTSNPLAGLVGIYNDGSRRRNVWLEPSTDGFKYCFVVPSTFLLLRRNGCIFATGNTGKTRSAIWAADYLLRNGVIKHVLISAPLSTLTPVWEQELFKVIPTARVRVLHGSRAKRLDLLSQDAEWYIINHHGLGILQGDLRDRGFGVLIIDELAVFRNRRAQLWGSAATVVNAPSMQYVWGMTGSPTPSAPTDAWAQLRLLTPDRVTRSSTKFRDLTMRQVSAFKWVARADATYTVHQAMQPSVRYTLDDVQELPPTSYVDRHAKLDPDAAKAYKMLFDKMVMITKGGETITSMNEGILQNKLLQVACGYIYTDKQKVYELPHQGRLDALVEVIEETDRKVIVFVPYVHALKGVTEFLRKHGETVELVHGGTSRGNRDKIFRAFQETSEPRILVAHPASMSHGLTLVAANTIVWYAPTNSLETYEQANARISRPGQKHKTLIAHLVGTPVEKATYARLKERARMQGMLLELFHSQEVEF